MYIMPAESVVVIGEGEDSEPIRCQRTLKELPEHLKSRREPHAGEL